jgi:hypothetical protein
MRNVVRHHRQRAELVTWERRLARRSAALKLLATVLGAVGFLAAVITGLGTRAVGPTLLAASPLLLSAGAAAFAMGIDDRVRRIRLVRVALGDRTEPEDRDDARRLANAAALAAFVAAALAIAGAIGSVVAFRTTDHAAVHALATAPFPLSVIVGAMSFRLRRLARAVGVRGDEGRGREAPRPA